MARKRRQNSGAGFEHWINQSDAQMFSGKLPVFQQDVESKPHPAPIKGWDAISPLSNMEPDYAVILDNAVPRPNWVELRGGNAIWSQGLGDPVESLMVYRPAEGIEEMFAAAGETIFEVTTFSMPSIVNSGFANARWQHINFTPAANATHLILVNGDDDAQIYNGTTWTDLSITGVSSADLININAHKRRLWFIEKESTSAWFLATDAIAGAATEFDVGSLLTKGSFLVAMGTWTVDGGNGPDDYAVFVSNKGQAVVYKGTDPNNNNAWFLVGVFNLPPPLGMRCLRQFGSDLLYISLEGLLPISKALPFDPSGVRSVALTNRIQNAMLLAAQNGRTLFGWEVELFPLQSLLLMNVPVQENASQVQFVMNTLTGAWCRFTGWDANCFAIFNESLYFGSNTGTINICYSGTSDVLDPIAMSIKTAFNYYDDPGRIKIVQMVRPFIVAGGSILPIIGADVDFGDVDFNAGISSYVVEGALWDASTSLWDTSTWFLGAPGNIVNDWESIGALGTAIALRMKINLLPAGIDVDSLSVFDSGLFDTAVFDAGSIYSASGQDLPILRLNSFQVTLEHGAAVG